jgi:predicted cobalt transporter CbtA
MQADIDKKWHATEQLQLNKKWVMGVIVTLLTGILIMLVKACVDKPRATPLSLQPQQTAPALPAAHPQQAAPAATSADSTKKQGQKGHAP